MPYRYTSLHFYAIFAIRCTQRHTTYFQRTCKDFIIGIPKVRLGRIIRSLMGIVAQTFFRVFSELPGGSLLCSVSIEVASPTAELPCQPSNRRVFTHVSFYAFYNAIQRVFNAYAKTLS